MDVLSVSRPAVYKHLTLAVHEERLVEILMYRTSLVSLPGVALPPLYAVPDADASEAAALEAYKLTPERLESRGANGVSFLTTPDGYQEFVRLQRLAHGSIAEE
jgi:hypothetical protein